jgi:mono/diheme cytochrome c family protein
MKRSGWGKGVLVVSMAVGLIAFGASLGQAAITNSPHDFSGQTFSGGQICVVCHAPHNSSTGAVPLWNHDLSTQTYTVYQGLNLDSTPANPPDGASKLCLSCHDGTVAIDSFGGATGSTYVQDFNADYNLGTDLSNDHPISITYDANLASTDGGLFDPTTTTTTIGSDSFTKTGTIDAVMLSNSKVQCSSCHSVHNDYVASGLGGDPLLKISKLGSALCLTCHNK